MAWLCHRGGNGWTHCLWSDTCCPNSKSELINRQNSRVLSKLGFALSSLGFAMFLEPFSAAYVIQPHIKACMHHTTHQPLFLYALQTHTASSDLSPYALQTHTASSDLSPYALQTHTASSDSCPYALHLHMLCRHTTEVVTCCGLATPHLAHASS